MPRTTSTVRLAAGLAVALGAAAAGAQSPAPQPITVGGTVSSASDSMVMTFIENGVRTEVVKENGALVSVRHEGKDVPLDRVEEDDGTLRIKDENGKVVFEREIDVVPPVPPTSPSFYSLGVAPQIYSYSGGGSGRMQRAPQALRAFRAGPAGEMAESPRVMLGVQMAEPDSSLRGHLGLKEGETTMISAIHKSLPADGAGLEPYDIIVSVDGKSPASHEDVRKVLREKAPGDTVTFTVIHQGQRKDVAVKLEAYDAQRLEEAETEAVTSIGNGWAAAPGDIRAYVDSLQNAIVAPAPPGTPAAPGAQGRGGARSQLFIDLKRAEEEAARARAHADAHSQGARERMDEQMRRMEEQMRRVEEMMRQMQEREQKDKEKAPQTSGKS